MWFRKKPNTHKQIKSSTRQPKPNNSTSVVNHCQCQPNTSSRCLTESVTGTHDFEVTNYTHLDGMGIGKHVSSSTFRVGGYDWKIKFYPDGYKEVDSAGNASAYLRCVSHAEVSTKFTLNMLEKGGDEAQVTKHRVLKHTMFLPSYDWGYPKFVEKSRLESWSNGANSGNLIIRCVLTVIQKHRTEAKRNPVVVPQPNLQDHHAHMLKDEQGADVTFSVSGQLFRAHRCLLAARSPVFEAELFGPMKEKATQSIEVDGIEPQIFEALLHFVYTDSVPDGKQDEGSKTAKFQHLLVAADRYGLDRLRALCESKLFESMDVETVATTLVLAEQHHCKDLQEACIDFLAPRNILQAVMATDGFKHLVASSPLLMKEILEKVSRSV